MWSKVFYTDLLGLEFFFVQPLQEVLVNLESVAFLDILGLKQFNKHIKIGYRVASMKKAKRIYSTCCALNRSFEEIEEMERHVHLRIESPLKT